MIGKEGVISTYEEALARFEEQSRKFRDAYNSDPASQETWDAGINLTEAKLTLDSFEAQMKDL